MSASAPLGRPSRKTGRVEADCTSATITGDVDSDVISQAAATSFIHMQVLAVAQTPHSIRKIGSVRGPQGPGLGGARSVVPLDASLMASRFLLIAHAGAAHARTIGRRAERRQSRALHEDGVARSVRSTLPLRTHRNDSP